MNTWLLIGLGILVYVSIIQLLIRTNTLPSFIKTGSVGLLLSFHTQRGKKLADDLSKSNIWITIGYVSVLISVVFMVISLLVVAYATFIALFFEETSSVAQPQNALVIPGVNEFLPLSIAFELLIGIVIGLVVHEGGHAIYCRVANIEIESMGAIFLAIIPMGAFVEPNAESEKNASFRGRVQMFSAGVMNNFVLSLILFGLLMGPLIGAIAVVDGVHVGGVVETDNNQQFDSGDVIVGINDTEVTSREEYYDVARSTTDTEVTVDVRSANDDGTVERTVERDLVVTRSIAGNVYNFSPQTDITHVNGERVDTQAGLLEEIHETDSYNASITTANGETETAPAGAFAQLVTENSPLYDDGVPAETGVTIVEYDGERVVTESELRDVQRSVDSGDTVDVVLFYDGEFHSHEVTADDDGVGFSGVQYGVSGLVIDDFGVDIYPAEFFIQQLGGEGSESGFGQQVLFSIIAPLVSAVGAGIGYNFFGFTGMVTNFYTVTGPLSVLGSGTVFAMFNVFFWTAWINIQLGAFNCLPAYPLDGGRILEASIEKGGEYVGVENSHTIAQATAVTMTVLLIVSVLLILFL